MHTSRKPPARLVRTTRTRFTERAQSRVVLLVLAGLVLGFAAGVFWQLRKPRPEPVDAGRETAVQLSESTKAVLRRLDSPVEIRFYSLLGETNTSDSLRAFAGRAEQLLDAFQDEGQGKVKVIAHHAQSDADLAAAAADGLRGFNLDKGDACYLGLAVSHAGQRESFAQLAPEWEPALEFDLTRAILRVAGAPLPTAPAPGTSPADLAATEEVKQAIPNLASVSLEEGTQRLRETALKEFTAAAKELEQRVRAAQSGKSAGEQPATARQIQQIQAEQTEKLKAIAERLQTQIEALERLKAAVGEPASPARPGATPPR